LLQTNSGLFGYFATFTTCNFIFVQSVCEGHPDKVCDQISDAILDACYTLDPKARVGVETLVTTNKIVLAGEITVNGKIDFEAIARQKIAELDYLDPVLNFTNKSDVEVYIHQQSPDIAVGVDDGGAGDQGMMFGYACNETPELMPLPISMAHSLVRKMDELQRIHRWMRPDGKSQVTVNYDGQKPVSIETVVLAKPVNYNLTPENHPHFFYENVVVPVLAQYGFERFSSIDSPSWLSLGYSSSHSSSSSCQFYKKSVIINYCPFFIFEGQ